MENIKRRLQQGFTLLEMMVVITIVIIMTAIVLNNLPAMNSGISIDLVAQEVAIYVRGAQTYTTAVKADTVGDFYNTFGVHFQNNNKNFVLFVNDKHCGFTNNSTDDKCMARVQERYELPSDFYIKKLIGENENISSDLDVVFFKPSLEAIFFSDYSVGDTDSRDWSYVKVCLASKRAPTITRLITIYNNGQIAVSNDICGIATSLP